MSYQSSAFGRLDASVSSGFASIRASECASVKNEEAAQIEKLGKLMAAIASFDFIALNQYAQTATETPGVSEVIYKTPEGNLIASAKSKSGVASEETRSFDITSDGSKLGTVTIGFHTALIKDKIHRLDDMFAEQEQKITDLTDAALVNTGLFIAVGLFMVAVIMIGAIVLLFRRSVAAPLDDAVEHMQLLAEGHTEVQINNMDRRDEIGAIARALSVFKRNLEERAAMQAHEKQEEEAARQRAVRVQSLCTEFDADVRAFFNTFEDAIGRLDESSRALSTLAEETTRQSTSMSAASQNVNENIASVARSSEDLSTSVREIAQQINHSATLVNKTVAQTQKTSAESEKLLTYAQKVNEVLDLISGISHQTRLLSLNATIEAERAGDMGKGFAVVANEVRTLASQTEESVKQIQQTISDVQNASTRIGSALEDTRKDVDAVNQSSSIMAAAAEEQASATATISQTMRNAADETGSVVRSLGQIVTSASRTGEAASTVHDASANLASKAKHLRESVETFLVAVRKA